MSAVVNKFKDLNNSTKLWNFTSLFRLSSECSD